MIAESANETDGQDVLVRRAKTQKKYAKQLPVALTYEFIVGRPITWLIHWAGGR